MGSCQNYGPFWGTQDYLLPVTSRKSTAAFLYCTIWAVVFTTVLSCILEHVLRLLHCDLDPTDRRDDGCFKHVYNCCAADKHDQHTRISLWPLILMVK